jgi:hypothetical protein
LESINKRQGSLILITLEHIEYLYLSEVTKDIYNEIPRKDEEKKAEMQGRINSFDGVF